MDGPRLAAIEKVSVKIIGFADETAETETEIVTELFLKVETVKRYNDTALVFLMANDQALFVWNGETVYKNANGTLYPVCEATATCAALYVDDNDEKEQLEDKANAALEAGGFTEAAAAARRRLGPHCGPSHDPPRLGRPLEQSKCISQKLQELDSSLYRIIRDDYCKYY